MIAYSLRITLLVADTPLPEDATPEAIDLEYPEFEQLALWSLPRVVRLAEAFAKSEVDVGVSTEASFAFSRSDAKDRKLTISYEVSAPVRLDAPEAIPEASRPSSLN